MASITVKMRDGTTREFPHKGRAGGSYTKRLKLEGAFAVVEDEYGNRTAIPAMFIDEVVEKNDRY